MSVIHPEYLRQPAANERGFTLLEVLVTVVIFSVGLLGIAGLQMTGMKQTHNSLLRSVATTQAVDIADRMRANSQAVLDGDYKSAPTSCTADCASNQCTSAQMAEYDLCQWQTAIAGDTGAGITPLLPGAAGTVCIDSTPAPSSDTVDWSSNWECDDTGDVYAIKLQWTERALDDDDELSKQSATKMIRRHFYMRVSL